MKTSLTNPSVRTNSWLEERFYLLYSQYFSDVDIPNSLIVKFGSKTRRRLGSISSVREGSELVSVIRINQLFQDPDVPEYVIDATLLHEFAHYTHGFHSPHPQRYTHPHRGNVIHKELAARACDHLVAKQDRWLKAHYGAFLLQKFPPQKKGVARSRANQVRRRIRMRIRGLFFL